MSLEQELKDLCAEANNIDYYLAGSVDGDKLEAIIRKYIDPEYRYENPHWGRIPTVDKEPTADRLTVNKILNEVYDDAIKQQLEQGLFISQLMNRGTDV